MQWPEWSWPVRTYWPVASDGLVGDIRIQDTGRSSWFPACTSRYDVTGTDSCRNVMDGSGPANKVRLRRPVHDLGTVNERPSSSLLCIYTLARPPARPAGNVATRLLGGRAVFCRTWRLEEAGSLLATEDNTLPTHSRRHAICWRPKITSSCMNIPTATVARQVVTISTRAPLHGAATRWI